MAMLRAGVCTLVALLALCLPMRSSAKPEEWRRCLEPLKVGPGKAALERWHFDATSATCHNFTWGGAAPNGNNFALEAACKAICAEVPTCELPAAVGSGEVACMAYMPRWAYDPRTATCRRFIYGGCGGNQNNFEKEAACKAVCWIQPDLCRLEAETGPCKASMSRFAYDPASNDCVRFTYGGCKGNRNSFKTRAHCLRRCKMLPID